EARAILETVSHPKATEWLEKINAMEPSPWQTSAQAQRQQISEWFYTPVKDIPAGTTIGSLSFSDGTSSRAAVIVAFSATVVAGIIVGLLLMVSSWIYYLFFVNVAVAAGIVVGILMLIIKRTKLRDTRYILTLAIVSTVVIYGSYRVGNYVDYLRFVHEDLRATDPSASFFEANALANEFLRQETGLPGLPGYIHLEALNGLGVSDFGSDEEDFRLNMPFTYVYWLLEIFVIGGIVFVGLSYQMKTPFCHKRDEWMEEEIIGYVARKDGNSFVEALNARDYRTAVSFMQAKQAKVHVKVGMCNPQSNEAVLSVLLNAGRKSSFLLEPVLVPGDLVRTLLRGGNESV
ncbi:MAG: hypothetical protein AAFV33_19775, partial [Chloroflexota bacterium]